MAEIYPIEGGITAPAKAKAHEIIVADGKPVNGSAMKYDFDDPKATTSNSAPPPGATV